MLKAIAVKGNREQLIGFDEMRARRSKIVSWATLLLVIGSITLTSQTPARHHAPRLEVLAAAGPVTLKAENVRVALKPVSGTILPRLQSLKRDQQIVLRVDGIALKQPAEVLYQIILNLREGAVPAPGVPGFVGTLDLFQAEPELKGNSSRRSRLYPLTAVLERLQARRTLTEPFTVTIAPLGKPAGNAETTIERVELILQTGKPD